MAITPGTFTSLLNVKTRMASLFKMNQIASHIDRGSPVFDRLFSFQEFEIVDQARMLIDGRTCNTIEAHWISGASATIQEDADLAGDATDCVIGGAELGSDSKNYVPNLKFHVEGKVLDKTCKDLETKEEKEAALLTNLMMSIKYELEKRVHAVLDGNPMTLVAGDIAGVGALQETGTIWDIDGTTWDNLGAKLIAKFKVLADKKQFFNPVIVSGGNLYEEQWLALYKDGDNTDYTSTLLGANRPVPLVNNLLDLDTSTGHSSSFIVDNANIAYFNTYKWQNSEPMDQKDQYNTQTFMCRIHP